MREVRSTSAHVSVLSVGGKEEEGRSYSARKRLLAGTCSLSPDQWQRPGRPGALLLRLPFCVDKLLRTHVIVSNKGNSELIC